MLDTFRKRASAQDQQRATTAPAGSAQRTLLQQPQLRVPGSGTDAPRFERQTVPPPSPEPAIPPAQPEPEPRGAPQPVAGGKRESARLIVGPDIKLNGAEITDCDTLIVEGQVDACMDSRVVEVADQGIFRGKVNVEIAEIRGRFEGELTANKQLTIRASGTVTGKIRYGKLLVDEGGQISGDVAASDPSAGSTRAHAAIRPPDRSPERTGEPPSPPDALAVPATTYRTPGGALTQA